MQNFIGIIRLIYNTFCSGHFREREEFVVWDVFARNFGYLKKVRTTSSALTIEALLVLNRFCVEKLKLSVNLATIFAATTISIYTYYIIN